MSSATTPHRTKASNNNNNNSNSNMKTMTNNAPQPPPSTMRKSRRRRKPLTVDNETTNRTSPPSHDIIDDDVDHEFFKYGSSTGSNTEKENYKENQKSYNVKSIEKDTKRKPLTKQTTKHKATTIVTTNESFASFEHNNNEDITNQCNSLLQDLKLIQSIFNHNNDNNKNHTNNNNDASIIQNLKSDIEKHVSIMTLVKLSIQHPTNTTSFTTTTNATIIEGEKSMVLHIINIARKCIRYIVMLYKKSKSNSKSRTSSTNEYYNIDSTLALLRVSLYCIRSTIPTIIKMKQSEKISISKETIKLLFHVMKCVEDVYMYHHDSGSSNHYKEQTKKEMRHLMDVIMITVSGFELLGTVVSFLNENKTANNENDSYYFFPRVFVWDEGTKSNEKANDLTFESFVNIAIHSIITTADMLWKFQVISMQLQSGHETSPLSSIYVNQYGYRFCSYVNKFIIKSESRKTSTCGDVDIYNLPCRSLLSRDATSWIAALLSISDSDGIDKGCYESCLSHVSRIKQIFLNGANQMDQLANHSSSSVLDNRSLVSSFFNQGLCFRQDAIMVSLFNQQTTKDEWVSYLPTISTLHIKADIRKRFDKACISAASHSSVIVDQMKKMSVETLISNLMQFHNIVGSGLDTMVKNFDNTSASYAEYCACRAIHVGEYGLDCYPNDPIPLFNVSMEHCNECIFTELPYRFAHSRLNCCTKEQCPFESLLSLLYASVTIKMSFQNQSSDKRNNRICISTVKRSIASFRKSVLNLDNSIENQQNLVACQKILSKIQLISFATNLAKSVRDSNLNISNDKNTLYLLGLILGECYSPLNYIISKQRENEAISQKYLYTAIEGYLRAAGIIDVAAFLEDDHPNDEESLTKDYLSTANRYISKCGILTHKIKRKIDSLQYFESVAKVSRSITSNLL